MILNNVLFIVEDQIYFNLIRKCNMYVCIIKWSSDIPLRFFFLILLESSKKRIIKYILP